ncbi:MAG: glycosyltransferase N-terminal domain-containing protein [Gemmatimonadales bacterium]
MTIAPTGLAYRALARAAYAALPLARAFHPKLARGDRERRAALARWLAWAERAREPERPLLWCHASSVGEGLQAEAVLGILRSRHPEWQIVASFFSPSAERLARRLPVDHADYLPYDLPGPTTALLDALRPTALVFAKLDLWPELATTAARRGVAIGIVAATVSPVSGRLRWPGRILARPGYQAVNRAAAVQPEDAARLESLGTPGARIDVAGDPAVDSALRRAAAVDPADPLLELGAGAPTLVAGSTWAADEAALIPALVRVRATHPGARLLLVPHEPTPGHVAAALERAQRHGLAGARRASEGGPPGSLVVVDRVGVLMTLYGAGSIAFVGGGFGRRGLHSVLEPMAHGRPVLFGPHWASSWAAGRALETGAAREVRDAGELAARWLEWLDDDDARARAGASARALVERGRGAAEANAAMVERLMRRESGTAGGA